MQIGKHYTKYCYWRQHEMEADAVARALAAANVMVSEAGAMATTAQRGRRVTTT